MVMHQVSLDEAKVRLPDLSKLPSKAKTSSSSKMPSRWYS